MRQTILLRLGRHRHRGPCRANLCSPLYANRSAKECPFRVQTEKNSVRANVFRVALKADIAMAIRTRRTEMRISAPIFRSLSLMVPQVASAKTVLARPMRRTNLGGIGFRARAFGAGSNNGGMGTFYRSKHELVFVWKSGTAPHLNNFELGQHGRNRTNVWDYAGINTFRSSRMDELQMHPTVKPVALVVDAIKDCSKQGDIVLDPFCGSGTIIVAAERTGRKARAL